jgi:hypothetical protein
MLVYLDTSHLAQLERVSVAEPHRAKAFLEAWHDQRCELAFSHHHAQETAQLADVGAIRRRLAVVEEFNTIKVALKGSYGVIEWEITEQMMSAYQQRAADYSQLRDAIFSPSTVPEVKRLVFDARPQFLRLRQALGIGAEGDNLFKGLRSFLETQSSAEPEAPGDPQRGQRYPDGL